MKRESRLTLIPRTRLYDLYRHSLSASSFLFIYSSCKHLPALGASRTSPDRNCMAQPTRLSGSLLTRRYVYLIRELPLSAQDPLCSVCCDSSPLTLSLKLSDDLCGKSLAETLEARMERPPDISSSRVTSLTQPCKGPCTFWGSLIKSARPTRVVLWGSSRCACDLDLSKNGG
jgi:hypothetical protein